MVPKGARNVEVGPNVAKEARAAERIADIPNKVVEDIGHVRQSIAGDMGTIERAEGRKFAMHGHDDEQIRTEAITNARERIKADEMRLAGLTLLQERLKKDGDSEKLAAQLATEIANLAKNLQYFQDAHDDVTAAKVASELGQYMTAKLELDRMRNEAKS